MADNMIKRLLRVTWQRHKICQIIEKPLAKFPFGRLLFSQTPLEFPRRMPET